ncbi:MAG: hypothetical protein MHMPM18_003531 [Marteilia pararefringens]
MYVYNQDEVSNMKNVILSFYFTNRMVQYFDDNEYRMWHVFVFYRQPSDNGYSFTDYNVFSSTILFNDQVHEHFNYSGMTFYIISLLKQVVLAKNIQQNYSSVNAAASHVNDFAQLLNKIDENAGEDLNLKNDIGKRFENPIVK